MGDGERPVRARTETFWEAGHFRGTGDVVEFVVQVLEGEISDGFLVIGVDPTSGWSAWGEAELTPAEVLDELDAEVLGLLAAEMGARALILVLLRGGADVEPDLREARRLVALCEECERQGIGLADGVVISPRASWSLRGVAATS